MLINCHAAVSAVWQLIQMRRDSCRALIDTRDNTLEPKRHYSTVLAVYHRVVKKNHRAGRTAGSWTLTHPSSGAPRLLLLTALVAGTGSVEVREPRVMLYFMTPFAIIEGRGFMLGVVIRLMRLNDVQR